MTSDTYLYDKLAMCCLRSIEVSLGISRVMIADQHFYRHQLNLEIDVGMIADQCCDWWSIELIQWSIEAWLIITTIVIGDQ